MKDYLKNLALALPLALGAMLTLVAISMVVQSADSNDTIGGFILGLIGIPLLFATIATMTKQRPVI